MILRIKGSIALAVTLQLLILISVGLCYYSLNIYSFQSKTILEYIFFSVVAISFVSNTYFHGSWKNFDNLFIAFIVFFLGNRLLFDLCTDYWDVTYFGFFLGRSVSVNILNRAILNLIIAVCSYNLGVLLWRCFKKDTIEHDKPIIGLTIDETFSDRVVYVLLGIGFIFKAYYSFQIFRVMQTYGYYIIFLGGFEINRNLLMMFLECFYEIALFIIISRNRKMFFFEKSFLFLYIIMSLSTGQRGLAMLSVVFILFYMFRQRKLNLYLRHIIIFVFLLVVVSLVVSNVRGGKDVDAEEIMTSFFDFFYGQSVSLTVLVATIDYESQIDFSFFDLFGHIRYLITYYWDKITFQPPSSVDSLTIQAEEFKWYGQYISNLTNSKMYYQGMGLGSSYIAQFYAVGKEVAQFLGGLFVGFLSGFMNNALLSLNFLKRFWAFHALTIFIFLPRANLFEFVSMQWASYVVSFILYLSIVIKWKKVIPMCN